MPRHLTPQNYVTTSESWNANLDLAGRVIESWAHSEKDNEGVFVCQTYWFACWLARRTACHAWLS